MDASSSNDTSPSFCPHTWEPDFKLTLTFYLLPSPTPSPQSSPNICTDVTEAIGNTPMIKLNSRMCPPGRTIYAKCEFFNPCKSPTFTNPHTTLTPSPQNSNPAPPHHNPPRSLRFSRPSYLMQVRP